MFTFKGEGFPAFHGIVPQIHEEAFVAPQVFLSGDVRIGQYASLWPGVVAPASTSRTMPPASSGTM